MEYINKDGRVKSRSRGKLLDNSSDSRDYKSSSFRTLKHRLSEDNRNPVEDSHN
ncbi:hypothetical protein J6590_026431 [Homalodisca vitripennis]|nr:hypothetical protein J6590_026431 [Homalodisca vitripennis]